MGGWGWGGFAGGLVGRGQGGWGLGVGGWGGWGVHCVQVQVNQTKTQCRNTNHESRQSIGNLKRWSCLLLMQSPAEKVSSEASDLQKKTCQAQVHDESRACEGPATAGFKSFRGVRRPLQRVRAFAHVMGNEVKVATESCKASV